MSIIQQMWASFRRIREQRLLTKIPYIININDNFKYIPKRLRQFKNLSKLHIADNQQICTKAISEMVKKSKRRNSAIASSLKSPNEPSRAMCKSNDLVDGAFQDRLNGIRHNSSINVHQEDRNLERMPFILNKTIANLCNDRLPLEEIPKSILNNFFDVVANKINLKKTLLVNVDIYQNKLMTYTCKYNLTWPKTIDFKGYGLNKKGSSHNAALNTLTWLKHHHYMDTFGKPIFHYGAENRLRINNNSIVTTRNYSTESLNKFNKTENNERQTEIPQEFKDIQTIKSIFPSPQNVLHNCFDTLCNELQQKNLKLTPQYKLIKEGKSILWMCTYNLKWPETIKFFDTAKTKQEACYKTALAALLWLKQNNKITKEGRLIIYDKEEVSKLIKKMYPVIMLDRNVENNINAIIDLYENNLEKRLVIDTTNELSDDKNQLELNVKLPETLKSNRYFKGLDVYLTKERLELPISKYKQNIVDLLENNRILIIKGEPGCGKSTRVPQYILENWAKNVSDPKSPTPCKIIVTQPRRIAAISLAERVASERNECVGDVVGYNIRLDSRFNNRTGRIMYCTTGILLRRIQTDPKLSDCTHIILDEAHERDVNTDLLMNLVRNALNLNPNLQLLVMSATMDADLFHNYFNNAPLLHIPGFTYPVEQHFLNENYTDSVKTLNMCSSQYPTVITDDVVRAILHIHTKKPEGAILCFLPGWDEIMKVKNLLPRRTDMSILCLHSRMEMLDQQKIFHKPPPGIRKVILATNIAETSVTIDDVGYVIDTGIHKEERFNLEMGMPNIDNYWISQASALQRKGRAGRCREGECYHLYTETKFNELKKFSMPEILRTSLTKIVLDSKVYSNNMDAMEFIQQLICPPDKAAIEKAVEELKELELLDSNEKLTSLGRALSNFQLTPKLSKVMVNSIIFKCVTPIVDIATLFSAESILFSKSLVDRDGIRKVKTMFSENSDHLALMQLLEKWLNYVEHGDINGADYFCRETGLISQKIKIIEKLRNIHFQYLSDGLFDILPISDDFSDNNELVLAILLSGVGTVLQHRTWDIVKGRMKKSNVFITRYNQKATITSESVNSRKNKFPSMFLLHINETMSNLRHTSLVRETSVISPLTVLLFKNGELEIKDVSEQNKSDKLQSTDQVLITLQGTKIRFVCDKRQAIAIKKCKKILKACEQYYIYQLTKGNYYDSKINECWQELLTILNEIFLSQNVHTDC